MTQRQEIIERLNGLELEGGSHESLSAIAKAIYEPVGGWTIGACEQLRQTLVRLLGEADTAPSDGRITDEVRRDIDACTQSGEMFDTVFIVKSTLLCDLDRIDAAHEKAMEDSYRDGYQEGKRDGDDEWYEEHESYLEEHGWYQALDADKEVIHADDELFWKEDGVSAGRVTAIGVGQRAGWVWTLFDGCDVSTGHRTDMLRHHHAPTVEDVLTEFAAKLIERGELTNGAAQTIAEYAKRLKLAGSDAE